MSRCGNPKPPASLMQAHADASSALVAVLLPPIPQMRQAVPRLGVARSLPRDAVRGVTADREAQELAASSRCAAQFASDVPGS